MKLRTIAWISFCTMMLSAIVGVTFAILFPTCLICKKTIMFIAGCACIGLFECILIRVVCSAIEEINALHKHDD